MGVFVRAGRRIRAAIRRDSTTPVHTGQRNDGWTSALLGFNVGGQDKRLGTEFILQVLDSRTAENLWRSNDIASRIVEKLPDEAMRAGFSITMDDKEMADAVLKRVLELDAPGDGDVDSYLHAAMSKERAFGGSAIFPVMRDDRVDLSLPLNENAIVGLSHLQVFEPRELKPRTWYVDPLQPKFGQPETYWLFPRGRGGLTSNTGIAIHESRLIIFPGIRVTRDQVSPGDWGDSVLQRVHNVLRDFGVSWAAVGVMLTDFAQAVMSIKGLAELIAQDKDEVLQNRLKMVELSRSVIRATLIDSEEQYERKQTPVSGLADLLDRFESRLAAAADMPVTVLMGRSPAGLNATGDSDIELFNNRVGVYQSKKLDPRLKKLIRLVMLDRTGPTRGRVPDNWNVEYAALRQPSEKEKADTRKVVAETDNIYVSMGVVSPDEVAMSRWGGDRYSAEMSIDFEERARLEAQFTEEEARRLLESGEDESGETPTDDSGGDAEIPTDVESEEVEVTIEEVDEDDDPETPPDEFAVVKVRGHERRIKLRRRRDEFRWDSPEFADSLCLWIRVPDSVVGEVDAQLPSGVATQDRAHVTVLFLGPVDDERRVASEIRSAMAGLGPGRAQVTGLGAFTPKPGGLTPMVGLINFAGGTEIRARALSAARVAGIKVDRTFGFLPHMTIAMVDDVAVRSMQNLTSAQWDVAQLELVRGSRIVDTIPLMGPSRLDKIERRGSKYVVLSADGSRVLGEHDDEDAAQRQLRAIEASKRGDR